MSSVDGAAVYMDATITANRSLSPVGFRLLLAGVVGYNLVVMAFLLAIGAFPVPIFLGLDVAGLYIAFRVSNRRAAQAERVHVTADRIEVSRGTPGRERTVWRSPTAFTRVALERAGEHEARVRRRMSQNSLSVGAALSPDEREGFAEALQGAIRAARAERYPG
jgi:uncharacterized membrane protein